MELERTLVIIKPDAVAARLIGEVIKRFEERDLEVIALKMVNLTKEEWGRFYQVHQDKPFYYDFIEFMSSGPSIVMVLQGEGVIMEARRLIGETDPKLARLGTIRGDYATDTRHNIVHGSDSRTTAEAEISFFFKENELWSH
ncbi:MAG: nucleoside-diphosphate kinase [bacterium]|nr:nucleoside-diphosphate kinase [bacterium]